MKIEEEIADLCVKAIFAMAVFLAVAASWLFTQVVRLGTRLFISVAIDRGWVEADPEVDPAIARLIGSMIGGAVGVGVALVVIANGGPAPVAAATLPAGGILGAFVAPVEAQPWRSRPDGWVIDDWADDDRGY